MDWGSLGSTLFQTIGGVVGGLLGINTVEGGILYFSHAGIKGASSDFSSAFCCDDGKYYLFNQSTSKQDFLTIAFPERHDMGAEAIVLPGRSSFDVTPLFSFNAAADNTSFQLTASTTQKTDANGQAQQGNYKISASGRQIPTTGVERAIGAYLQVQAQNQKIIISPKKRSTVQLQTIPFVNIQTGGDTAVQFAQVNAVDGQVVLQLPQPLQDGDLIEVDVTAQIEPKSTMQEFLQQQPQAHLLRETDDLLYERLKNAPKLNWR